MRVGYQRDGEFRIILNVGGQEKAMEEVNVYKYLGIKEITEPLDIRRLCERHEVENC